MRSHLECGGCQVVAETETIAQTVDIFRTTRPDVIALDAGLRSAKGIDALSLFKTIRREAPAASIVIVTAPQSSDDRQIYLREGALECIAEPVEQVRHEASVAPAVGCLSRAQTHRRSRLRALIRQPTVSLIFAPSSVRLRRAVRARN